MENTSFSFIGAVDDLSRIVILGDMVGEELKEENESLSILDLCYLASRSAIVYGKREAALVEAKSLSCKILQDSCKKSLSYKILQEKVYLVRFLQEKVYLVRFLQIHKPP